MFDLLETASSRLCFAVHPVELSLYDGAADGEALAGLQLGGQREQALVLHVELVVQLGQHQDLRPPVLRVRRSVLQPVVCGTQTEGVTRGYFIKGNFCSRQCDQEIREKRKHGKLKGKIVFHEV